MDTDQLRGTGHLFPRKHSGTILAQIERAPFTGGIIPCARLKCALALRTNCAIPAVLCAANSTRDDPPRFFHTLQCASAPDIGK